MRIAALVRAGLAVGLLLLAAAPWVEASYSVNVFGNGTATASVWCHPNAPPAPPTATSTVTGAVPTTGFNPPPVPGCNPLTQVFVSAGSLWRTNTRAAAAGGDTVAWDHSMSLVTPTSPFASTSLFVNAHIITSPTTVEFPIFWEGSDPGTAQHLQWYDTRLGPIGPGSLLGEEIRIGPWLESFTKPISVPLGGLGSGGEAFLVMVSDGVATSTPEPAALALMAFGTAMLFVRRTNRR